MIENMQYPEGPKPPDHNELGGLKHKHITTQSIARSMMLCDRTTNRASDRRRRTLVDTGASNEAIVLHPQILRPPLSLRNGHGIVGKMHVAVGLRPQSDAS